MASLRTPSLKRNGTLAPAGGSGGRGRLRIMAQAGAPATATVQLGGLGSARTRWVVMSWEVWVWSCYVGSSSMGVLGQPVVSMPNPLPTLDSENTLPGRLSLPPHTCLPNPTIYTWLDMQRGHGG